MNDAPIRIRQWNTIEVNATAGAEGRATLTVNGTDVAHVRLSQPASKLSGFELGSAGSDPTGDDWLIDDLTYTPR